MILELIYLLKHHIVHPAYREKKKLYSKMVVNLVSL